MENLKQRSDLCYENMTITDGPSSMPHENGEEAKPMEKMPENTAGLQANIA